MFLQNGFKKCRSSRSQMFIKIGVLYKFLDIHKKIYVLKSLFNTVRGLKACNFNKKDTPTQVFSCEYHKIFKNSFFMEHLQWLLLNIFEEFLVQTRFVQKNL